MGVRIAGALCWHAEPLAFLDRCVRSLASVVDVLVAMPGPWGLFPEVGYDLDAEISTVEFAAEAAGVELDLQPWREYESQVEKRSRIMELAGEQSDWIFVVDGDEHVVCDTPERVRDVLAGTELDVAEVMLKVTTGYEGVNIPRPIRRVYRSSVGVSVEQAHMGYRTRDGRWLHGDYAYVRPEESEFGTAALVTVLHEKGNRGGERDAAGREYRRERNRLGTEEWQRG